MRFSGFRFSAWRPIALPLRRVLVAKTTHLGDLVISLPMATALKQRDPGCTVVFLTNSKTVDVASSCPDIDEVHAAPDSPEELLSLLISLRVDIFIQVNNSRSISAAASHSQRRALSRRATRPTGRLPAVSLHPCHPA